MKDGEGSSQRMHTHDPWTVTMVRALPEGVGALGQGGEGGKLG